MTLTIFQRLTAGYLSIMIMVLSFGGYTVFQLNRLARITHLAAGADSNAITITESLTARLHVMLALEKKYWISGDEDFFALFLKRQHEFQEQLSTLVPLISDSQGREDLDQIIALNRSYLTQAEGLAGKAPPSDSYNQQRDDRVSTMADLLDRVRLSANWERHNKIILCQTISTRVLWMTMGFAAACIVVGLTVSLITTRSIVHPVLELQKRTRDIAAGHFVAITPMKAPPEIRNLADDFNAMSEKLNELDLLKEDYISHLSHTLRTPLTSIWEAAGMLLGGIFDQDPESRRHLLSIVHDECRRLIDSVNRILDLSRMEAGMMDYRFVDTSLTDLIQTTVFKLDPIARSRDIRLEIAPQSDLPRIQADPETLTQLLENLIGNALKFTEPGGSVTLAAELLDGPKPRIRVSVRDTGCGIEHEYLERIFEKFRRIDNGKNTARGTGLGLSIAKHIVAAHGGTLWVESEKNKGSIFYFSLPLSSWVS